MTQRLGTQPINVGTTQIFNAPSMGLKGLIIDNASPFALQIGMEGSSINKTLQPASTDFFPVVSGFNGNVVYKSQALVSNPQSYTNYTLTVDAVGASENIDTSQYPVARPQAAVNPTASGQPIFSCTFGYNLTTGTIQSLNVYNPQNSGASYQFHSARLFTNSTTVGSVANLQLVSGADLNLPNGVSAISHDAGANPPVSTAHCTSQDDGLSHGGTIVETYNTQPGVTLDFLTFPDQVILRPGNNLRVAITVPAGQVVRFTLKWTEVPQILTSSTVTGQATGGNILIASTLVNNGNTPGTGVVSISQSASGSPTSLYIDNQGNLLFSKGGMHFGQVTNGDTLDTDGSGNLYFKSASTGGNPTLNFQPNLTGTNIMTIRNSGIQALNGGAFDFQTAGTVLNGGTSGTATLFQDFIGNTKRVLIVLNNFRTAAAVQNLALPVAFTFGAWVRTGATGTSATNAGVGFTNGGALISMNAITALATGGGTGTAQTLIDAFSIGEIVAAFNNVQFQAGGTAGHSGLIWIEGQ